MSKLKKRGMELSISFIVTTAIALIVLIIIALFFMGKMEWLMGEEGEIEKTAMIDLKELAKAKCQLYCNLKNKEGYENPGFSETLVEGGFTKCADLGLPEFDEECKAKECTGEPNDCEGRSETDCKFGCAWDTETEMCSGISWACNRVPKNENDCNLQGCTLS